MRLKASFSQVSWPIQASEQYACDMKVSKGLFEFVCLHSFCVIACVRMHSCVCWCIVSLWLREGCWYRETSPSPPKHTFTQKVFTGPKICARTLNNPEMCFPESNLTLSLFETWDLDPGRTKKSWTQIRLGDTDLIGSYFLADYLFNLIKLTLIYKLLN